MSSENYIYSYEFILKIANLISSNEGSYGSINRYDGNASSIGILQWHGERAKNLLELIISKNQKYATLILSKTNLIEDVNKDNSYWNHKILNSVECDAISKLLTTSIGIEAQNELLTSDIKSYIFHGKTLGIHDPKALIFFCDLENQLGPIVSEDIVHGISQNLDLEALLAASIKHPSTCKKAPRRYRSYSLISKLTL